MTYVSRQPCPTKRGVSRSSRNAGRAAVGADGIGARCFAGRATVSKAPRAHDRCDRRTAKSCGPDARGLASSLAVMQRPTGARIDHPQGDGAIVQRSRGEHDISRQTTAQGRPGCLRLPCSPLCRSTRSLPLAWRSTGANRLPAFPAPSFHRGQGDQAKLGRDEPRGREGVSADKLRAGKCAAATCSVIARSPCDEAIQTASSERS